LTGNIRSQAIFSRLQDALAIGNQRAVRQGWMFIYNFVHNKQKIMAIF
jgi:hypothetical protein